VDLGIAGRVALVTASSKGLGRASALALAAEGARVVICARGEEALGEAAEAVDAAGAGAGDGDGGRVLAVVDDVTHPEAPGRLVAATVEHFGALDILVANGPGPPPARSLEVDDEAIVTAVNANLTTSVRLVRAAVPHMRAVGWGRICCITSRFVKEPSPTLALSNLARTGLWAWAKTAAADLFPDGITLNLACPGAHATGRTKALLAAGHPVAGPVGDPADFGRMVAFLCSEPARFVSGVALQVDGGATSGLL
jgi:3-oxoacyl-[acyl-carrier protein] reductase